MTRGGLNGKVPSLLGFLKTAVKTPCLPAKFDPRVASSRNTKIHKHFVAALTPSPTRAPTRGNLRATLSFVLHPLGLTITYRR